MYKPEVWEGCGQVRQICDPAIMNGAHHSTAWFATLVEPFSSQFSRSFLAKLELHSTSSQPLGQNQHVAPVIGKPDPTVCSVLFFWSNSPHRWPPWPAGRKHDKQQIIWAGLLSVPVWIRVKREASSNCVVNHCTSFSTTCCAHLANITSLSLGHEGDDCCVAGRPEERILESNSARIRGTKSTITELLGMDGVMKFALSCFALFDDKLRTWEPAGEWSLKFMASR